MERIIVTDHYRPPIGGYDEAIAPDGTVRPTWSGLAGMLGADHLGELLERRRQADRILDAEGAGHLVHDLVLDDGVRRVATAESRPWRLDPIPIVLDHAEFEVIAKAVEQRARLVNVLLADVYGEQRLLRERVMPAALLYSLPAMRTTAPAPIGTWAVHLAVDVVRTGSGAWRVVQQIADAPSGLGYAVMNRAVTARVMPEVAGAHRVAPIVGALDTLRAALAAQASSVHRNPRTVVLSGGPSHPSYVEQSYLALHMGFHLVEGGDLVVRQGRVWLRALDGLEPVDVIYRRVEDRHLDPLSSDTRLGIGTPALDWAAQRGLVSVANAVGASLTDGNALDDVLADACRLLLGEPIALDALGAREVLGTTPALTAGGTLEATPVVLRFHAIVESDRCTVVPGATGRVLAAGDPPVAPTSRSSKDVWVVGAPATVLSARRRAPQPQVDLGTSVPRRAAEALYWVGRSAERAEFAARAVRTIGSQCDLDPTLQTLAGGQWASGAVAVLRSVRSLPPVADEPAAGAGSAAPIHHQVAVELRGAERALVDQLGTLVVEATSVREFLSTTTGRVLGRLARVQAEMAAVTAAAPAAATTATVGTTATDADALDAVLVDLAALAGLATESTVRGPAWRFLDLGRRLERALVVLGTVEAGLGAATDPIAFQPLAECVLSVNESLVAYRRRYRSDVVIDAVLDLLVGDDGNPRGLAFQLDRLREHVASLVWREGDDLVHRASLGAMQTTDHAAVLGRRPSVDALVIATRGPLLELADAVVRSWFSAPANPMMIGRR